MDQSLRMRCRQADGNLHTDAQDLTNVQWPIAIQPRLQRIARDVLHHQVRRGVFRFDVVNRHNVIIHDSGRSASFASESFASRPAAR